MLDQHLSSLEQALRGVPPMLVSGRVTGAAGLTVEIGGVAGHVGLGDRVLLATRAGPVDAEIVAFHQGIARAMPYGGTDGIGPGTRVEVRRAAAGPGTRPGLPVCQGWLGRIVDPLGRPLDRRGPLPCGPVRSFRGSPPDAAGRARLGDPLELGVRALDLFCPMRTGQRLGLFAGSGVGKSTLMSMLARGAACDVAVFALVGERGREVREFVEDDLGPEGLARSVLVVATSDQPPLMRRQAAYAAMAVAEAFRDEGRSVLLMMDSVTRFCLALREIGLAAGEPPATRGYPPSVFAELPGLLERAGPGPASTGSGAITALFTVLVEGDDHNEPVADAVRGILDGHVVMDRTIGETGRYPAVDVLRSLSRAATGCLGDEDAARVTHARRILARWGEMADMVRLGAYKPGSDAEVDEAIRLAPRIEAVLRQGKLERGSRADTLSALAAAMQPDRQGNDR